MVLLVVQRGHCYRTSGATGAPGEQQFATAVADRTKLHVNAIGHDVRIINADVPDSEYRGDAFVAIHYDSSLDTSTQGASVGYQTDEGKEFALDWKYHYARLGWTHGFREDNYTPALRGYYGVREAVSQGNRIAFISEAGFHLGDADLLAPPEGPDRVAKAIAAAIGDIFGGNMPPPSVGKDVDDVYLVKHPDSTKWFFIRAGFRVWMDTRESARNTVKDHLEGGGVVHFNGFDSEGFPRPLAWNRATVMLYPPLRGDIDA